MLIKLVKCLFNQPQKGKLAAASSYSPRLIPRRAHPISRKHISRNVLKVLYRLSSANFEALIVGGGVRDLLLGKSPKDFDVATNAKPHEIKALFGNSYKVGRRFPLMHVRFGDEIIEIITFRGKSPRVPYRQQKLKRNNPPVYGQLLVEDAKRRDFTLNAIYYNIKDFSLIDYAGGIQDIENRVVRTIIDAAESYREDPVRMLRAIRFAAKLDFHLSEETDKPIKPLLYLLKDIPSARMFIEVIKLFCTGCAQKAFLLLREKQIWDLLFPSTADCLPAVEQAAKVSMSISTQYDQQTIAFNFLLQAFHNTDKRFEAGKPLSAAFLFAVLLWPAYQELISQQKPKTSEEHLAIANALLYQQSKITHFSGHIHERVKMIWQLQESFEQSQPNLHNHLLKLPAFKAAYDFLLLRARAGEAVWETAVAWETVYKTFEKQRSKVLHANQDSLCSQPFKNRGKRSYHRRKSKI